MASLTKKKKKYPRIGTDYYCAVVDWVCNRIKHNKNAIILFVGATGSGKTYGALELGRLIAARQGTPFTIAGNVSFQFDGLRGKMMLPANNKPGTVFLFEEVGAVGGGAASREWQTKSNAMFFSFLQTTRSKNQVFIMTTPTFENLDAGARQLVHLVVEPRKIYRSKNVGVYKPLLLQANSQTRKIYRHYLLVKQKGHSLKYTHMFLKKSPVGIIKPYERMKEAYVESVITQITAPKEEKKKDKTGKTRELNTWHAAKRDGQSNKRIALNAGCSEEYVRRSLRGDYNPSGYVKPEK